MERYMKDFNVDPKNRSEEAQKRWRKAAWLVKNRRRRFRDITDPAKRSETEEKKRGIQEKIRIALYVKKAALTFIDAGLAADAADAGRAKATVPDEVINAGFGIDPDELAAIVRNHDIKFLRRNGGVEGLARDVSVSITEGINSSEVPTRQNIYGSNRFTEKPPRTFLMFVWDALQDLTLMILMVCALLSIGVGIATDGWPSGMYDGLGILISVFLVVIVTASSDYRQSLQFRDLDKEKKKILIQTTRDGRKQEVYTYDLVVGDIVELAIGDVVPADGIYISGYGLVIDESSLTGESEPVNIDTKRPFLLAGTSVQDGSGKMLVTAVGMKTEWGKLMETLSEGGEDETPLQVKLNGVATVIGQIGLGFAVVTFLVLVVRFLIDKWQDGEITHWYSSDFMALVNDFAIAVTIIVVAVPEGLPLAVTLSLAFAMKKLMNDKALVRHLSACETMGGANCICTDKTGTLTTNHMVVDKIWICERATDVVHEGKGEGPGLEISGGSLSSLLQVIFLNTGCDMTKDENGNDRVLGTPTDKALFEFGLRLGGNFHGLRKESPIVKLEPFNSNRKKMSALVTLPNGCLRGLCKGASEIVLRMCDKVLDGSGESVPLSEEQIKDISDVINGFASEALRTLCLAYIDLDGTSGKHTIPEFGYTLLAIVGIKDPVRPGVRDAVQTCLDAGITVRMVTGDNINTAKAIARECGILTEDGIAIEGPDFRIKSTEEMLDIIPKLQVMARSSPMDKHTLVITIRKMEDVVAVTGDGTNDAPALHEANIGFAMGIAGTEVAKENADVIIMDDNFSTIVTVAKWGRSVYINIQKFVQFQLTVNVVALMTNFVTACVTGSAPLTAVQLLWVNMIMDTLGALALATEPPTDALMKKPPVRRGEGFITRIMWRNIFGQSIFQLVVLGILYFDGEHLLGLSGTDATDTLNTLIFNAFVFCQVFNEINSREMEKINVFRGMFSNWVFLAVIGVTVIFQAIIVEFLGTFASTVPLSWQLWVLSILLGAVSLPVAVIIKCIPVGTDKPKEHHDGYEPLPSGPDMA